MVAPVPATQADVANAINVLSVSLNTFQAQLDQRSSARAKLTRKRIAALRTDLSKKVDDVGTFTKKMHDYQAAVEILALADAAVGSLIAAVKAGRAGDQFGAATNSLASVSAVFKGAAMAVLAGTAGSGFMVSLGLAIAAGVLDMASTIVEAFAPAEQSLVDQIERLLRQLDAEHQGQQLQAAFVQVEALRNQFSAEGGAWEERSWDDYAAEIKASVSQGTVLMDQAAVWLKLEDNQRLAADWVEVLDLWVQCHVELFFAVTSAFAHSYKRALHEIGTGTFDDGPANATQDEKLRILVKSEVSAVGAFGGYLDRLSADANDLLWPARNASRLFSIGDGNRRIYSALGCTAPLDRARVTTEDDKGEQPFQWRYLGGLHDDLTVLPRSDASTAAQIVAWETDGTNFEMYVDLSKDDDWHPALAGAGSNHTSFDVGVLDTDRVALTIAVGVSPQGVLQVEVLQRAAEALARTTPPTKHTVALPARPQGVARGFTSTATNGGDAARVHVAFRDATNQVWVAHVDGPDPTKVGAPAQWCTQVFGRDGVVWAVGGHRIARLPWDASPTAQWVDVSPDPDRLDLTGSWEIVYLDPPGPDGLMVATLGHQLLFWTHETGWRKGQEDESDIAFHLVRSAAEPVCHELVSLRDTSVAARETLANVTVTNGGIPLVPVTPPTSA